MFTQCLGQFNHFPDPGIVIQALETGDQLLLCSDVPRGMAGSREIEAVVSNAESIRDASRHLVKAANHSGGKDNITVVLLKLY